MIVRTFAAAFFALALGCSGTRSAAELPATDAPSADAPTADAPPADAPATDAPGAPASNPPPEQLGDAPVVDAPADGVADASITPASLYEGCRDRVEGLQVPGECTTDADCTKVGCSQEVCMAAKDAGEFMSTCEILPCFRALDTCGCHEGVCSWTVRADLPPAPGKIPLPAK